MAAPTRREVLQGALRAASWLALPAGLGCATGGASRSVGGTAERRDLQVALRVARWLTTTRIARPSGLVWPADPTDPQSTGLALYHGSPGIVMFLLELYRATGDAAHLEEARRGADHLAANLIEGEFDGSLYGGVAGRSFVLGEAWRVSGEARYRTAALAGVDLLRQHATPAGEGVEWDPLTDIVGGSAGIILFLLYAAKVLAADSAADLALRAGRRLVEVGERAVEGGTRWLAAPDDERNSPNFSHGTAGVAYALATLHEVTGEPAFLAAALAGANYLDRVTERYRGGCRIFRTEPDARDIYYVSWCHGGPGTARLFYQLYRVTFEDRWLDRVLCFAGGVTDMGAPVERSPGHWNNVSQCCGNAGIGEFFLALDAMWPGQGHLEVARRAAADILARATEEAGGLKWIQAEHRVKPELLVAQTGFMQGAAGVGTFFLHLDGAAAGRPPFITLPDSPWG